MYFGQTWLDFHLFRLILSRVVLCLKEEIFEVNKHIMIFHNATLLRLLALIFSCSTHSHVVAVEQQFSCSELIVDKKPRYDG